MERALIKVKFVCFYTERQILSYNIMNRRFGGKIKARNTARYVCFSLDIWGSCYTPLQEVSNESKYKVI